MPLTGELTDLSLAELIEFFCNQRKTGRLMVEYPHSPAYFYLQSGAVVHASIGMLRGIEAVYYALTQSNASFKFSSSFEPPEVTINQPWTSVVLEGLRRMDEGIKPKNPFPDKPDPVIQQEAARKAEHVVANAPVAQPARQAESQITKSIVEQPVVQSTPSVAKPPQPLPAAQAKSNISELVADVAAMRETEDTDEADGSQHVAASKRPEFSPTFLSSTQSTARFSQPWKLAAIFGALVLIIGGIAVPWYARAKAQKAASQQSQTSTAAPAETTASQPAVSDTATQAAASDAASQIAPGTEAQPTESADPASTTAATSDAADAAKKEREARAREEARLKAKENAAAASEPATARSTQPAAAGSKKAVVQVTYDENGRVTGASGSDPTALRIARQKRFPPGKAGTATVTIPIN